ncbi:MAG: anaerobic sulfatase maturase [Gemmatimonadota bacterium]|jgi:uncharacterized protein
MGAGEAPASYHVLAKPTGAICNLDCEYCFFLSKEALYPGDTFRMSDAVLDRYIRQLLGSQAGPEVAVAWQGGEPTLMGLDFFRRMIERVEKYRKPGQKIEHSMQTNGTRLDDAWAAFFREHDFLIGLSVDGPRDMHDRYRVDKGGKGTFDRVMRGWEVLQRHGVEVNVLCTVHAANADHPEAVYRFFRDDLGARFLQFIPIVERVEPELVQLANAGWRERPGGKRPLYTQTGDRVTDRSVAPEAFGRFLIGVFDEWVQRDVGRVFVQHFDAALASWYGVVPGVCIFQQTCGRAVALEHNGDVYACDHFVEPRYRLGNIGERPLAELVGSAGQREFGIKKLITLPAYCRECDVRFACHGGCPKNRFIATPDGEPGLNYLCAGYKAYFRHIDVPMRLMAGLLSEGRPAAEAMALLKHHGWSPEAPPAGP